MCLCESLFYHQICVQACAIGAYVLLCIFGTNVHTVYLFCPVCADRRMFGSSVDANCTGAHIVAYCLHDDVNAGLCSCLSEKFAEPCTGSTQRDMPFARAYSIVAHLCARLRACVVIILVYGILPREILHLCTQACRRVRIHLRTLCHSTFHSVTDA